MKFLVCIAILGALSVIPVYPANIVVNGSFEMPDVPTGSFGLFGSIPGWTLASGPSIEIQDRVAGTPFQGNQFLELDSTGNSSVYQDLSTTPGLYTLSFAFSPRPGVAANSMQVFWNGSPLTTINVTGTGLPDTSWTVYSFGVTATGSTTRLQFTGLGPSDSTGEYVDDVMVDNVPEPASMGLLLSGALLVAVLYTRNRLRAV